MTLVKARKTLLYFSLSAIWFGFVAPISWATEPPSLEDGNGGKRFPKTVRLGPESNYGIKSFFGISTERDGVYECKSVDDPICTAADTTANWKYATDLNAPKPNPTDAAVYFNHIMSICNEVNTTLCVKDVVAIDTKGTQIAGKYLGKYQETSRGDFAGVPEMNLSASIGKGLLFEFAGVENSGGTSLYMLNIYTGAALSGPKKSGESLRKYQIRMENFAAELIPIRKVPYTKGPNGQNISPTFTKANEACFWPQDDLKDPDWCPVAEAFPKGYRFGMTITYPMKLSGWFHGRVGSPTVNLSSTNSITTVKIEALPISLPEMDSTAVATQLPKKYFDVLNKFGIRGGWSGLDPEARFEVSPSGPIWLKNPRYPMDMAEYFGATYEAFGNQSTFTKSVWRISSLGQEGISDRCKPEGFAGIVTTNAFAYSSGPPEFNSQTQSLDYKVTSPHLDENGLLNRGSYDLVVESTLARCLYGFTDAPVSASISVISASGEAQVATTSVGQKAGYFYLSAQGFTYSTPTIRVKLTQDKSDPSTTSLTPSPTSTSKEGGNRSGVKSSDKKVNKVSIKCVKGKEKKTFYASLPSKPSCPKGWKKA